jgi:single-strand DNA-binding protein
MKKIMIIGRLGAKPELRVTTGGKQVTSFSVAVKEKIKGEERTDWFDVSVWGNQAEIASTLLDKGDLVHVDGSPSVKTFKTRSGEDKTQLQITARTFDLLIKARGAGEGYKKPEAAAQAVDDLSDIPF